MLDNMVTNTEIEVIGPVKWFDIKKGYGFVNSQYGSVFIHHKHLMVDFPCFKDGLIEGTTVNLIAVGTRKGIQCKKIISIDESTAIHKRINKITQPVIIAIDDRWHKGYIKWFNQTRGFGFVSFDSAIHKADAILHVETVKSANIVNLDNNQIVYIKIGNSSKGIRVIEIRNSEQILAMDVN
jgi:cold shock protein